MDNVENARWLRRLWRRTIWHPDAIPPDEWKYRTLKRVWLPVWDIIAILGGLAATAWGSPLLNILLDGHWVDGAGILLSTVAFVALLGVIFPVLWLVELFAKAVLITMVGLYSVYVLLGSQEPTTVVFVVCMLALGLPLPFFRISLLGEEWKERHADDEDSEQEDGDADD